MHHMPPCGSICHDQGEDIRKWDGEPTWRLEAQVQEVQEKTAAKRHPSRKIIALVSVGAYLLARVKP